MYHTTQAIVLKKKEVGEADLLVTLYTKDFGKIHAFAQGIRKHGAKLRGHLETLSMSTVGIIIGGKKERIIHASVECSWDRIREDPDRIGAALYLLRLVDLHCMEGERDERLWNFLFQSFQELNREKIAISIHQFLDTCESQFLDILGYAGKKDMVFLGRALARPIKFDI